MTSLVFLGGMGRSGTNLLRNILDSHPEIASGPEFNFIEQIIWSYRKMHAAIGNGRISSYMNEMELHERVAEFLGGIFENYGKKRDRKMVVEKTPSNLWCFPELSHLFPSARFIHMVRDGRDVCCSHREVGKRMVEHGDFLSSASESALISIFHCAALWSETIRFGNEICGPESALFRSGRVITVKYEELVNHPELEIRRICDHLQVKYDQRMLQPERVQHDTYIDNIWVLDKDQRSPISTSSVGKWRKKLSLKDRVIFASKGQEGLALAGYEDSTNWSLIDLNISPEVARLEIESARREAELYSQQTRLPKPSAIVP